MTDAGFNVRDAELIVGTSAGARVAVQITSHLTLEELFQQQVDAYLQTKEVPPSVDFTQWRANFVQAKEGPADASSVLKRFGALALQTPTDSQEMRRNMIAAALAA